ncbi:MAG: carboxypeptidase regulatory-like domain-containing protein, partial [Candidatus Ratteibacteria bacterium]
MKRLKEIVLSVVCFLFFSNFSFSGVKFYGEVKDPITNNLISGVNVKLIGPNLQTTTTTPYQDFEGRNINFEINDVPRNSIFMIQCSKSGYVNTILPGGVGNSDTYISIPIISQSFYTNNIHGGTAPSHQSGKADIAGSVEGPFGPVSGVVISAKYIDNGQTIPSSQIRYLGDNFIPGNYNSTQNNGFFCIYNVEPKRPILITGTKTGFKFNQIITLGYPDSLTIGGIESIENYVSIQGKVIDINENPVSGANISIVGTNISTVSSSDGSFTLINVPPDSLLISKVSKSGYKDVYQNLYVESEQIECIAVSSNFYNQILLQIGQSHIQGKGDIGGSVGNIEGVVVKLYDYQGNEVNVKVYYMDE